MLLGKTVCLRQFRLQRNTFVYHFRLHVWLLSETWLPRHELKDALHFFLEVDLYILFFRCLGYILCTLKAFLQRPGPSWAKEGNNLVQGKGS